MIGSGIGVGVTRPAGLSRAIRSLFASGEKGVWFDPSDFSTMFQDSAGTTPVTAVGDPVGKILDKSGNGFHATQTTTTKRPLLQQDATGRYYLKFDGVDDFLVTPSIDFSATDKMSVFAGVRKLSDASQGIIYELSPDLTTNNGAFYGLAPGSAAVANYRFAAKGTTAAVPLSPSSYPAPITNILTHQIDIAGASNTARINGTSVALTQGSLGTGAFGNYPLYIGMRGGISIPFSGQLYSLVVRGALSDANQIAASEAYVNSKTGAY